MEGVEDGREDEVWSAAEEDDGGGEEDGDDPGQRHIGIGRRFCWRVERENRIEFCFGR